MVIIYLVVLITTFQLQCTPTLCKPFNRTNQICVYDDYNTTIYYITYSSLYGPCTQMGPNYYCHPGSPTRKCQTANDYGGSCYIDNDCLGHYCVNYKCRHGIGELGDDCEYDDFNCKSGLSCLARKCVPSLPVGSNCTLERYTNSDPCMYPMSKCVNGSCMKMFTLEKDQNPNGNSYLCSSIAINLTTGLCADRAKFPKLIRPKNTEFVKCTNDSACQYTNTNYIPAPYMPCQCARDSASTEGFCKFGGGEPEILASIEKFKAYYITSNETWTKSPIVRKYLMESMETTRAMLAEPAVCSLSYYIKNVDIVKGKTAFWIVIVLILVALIGPVSIILSLVLSCCSK